MEKLFLSSGINITYNQYRLIRYFVIGLLCITSIVIQFTKGGDIQYKPIIYLIALVLITLPRSKILRFKTPFYFCMELLSQEFRKKKNVEIYRALSQFKNLTIAKQDEPLGALYVFEQLKKFTNVLQPVFSKFIYEWQQANTEGACKYFADAVGTPEAEELSNIFSKVEDLKPTELKMQLALLQENIQRDRQTAKLKENEDRSNALYMLVIASAFIVLLNFLIVGFYIDQMNLLKFN